MITLNISEAQFRALDDAIAYYEMSDYGCADQRPLSDEDQERVRAIELLREKLDATNVAQDEWCPVCHSYHLHPGKKTDAGALVEPCPLISQDDPRNQFENYPHYTR